MMSETLYWPEIILNSVFLGGLGTILDLPAAIVILLSIIGAANGQAFAENMYE